MTLNKPFEISSRLLPCVRIGNGTISIEYSKRNGRDGRVRYQWYIDTPAFNESGDDLQSGCCGGSIREGMASLLFFLSAAAESFRYRGQDGENADLFPLAVVEWAYQYSDEISMLTCELEENPELITE